MIDQDALVQQLLELDAEIAAAESRQRSAAHEAPYWEGSPTADGMADPRGDIRSLWLRQLHNKRQQLEQMIQRLIDAEEGDRDDA